MSLLRLDPAWKKQKLMMQDYSYIANFVSLLRSYNMLKRSNQDWVIYPKKNFKSNKNKRLSNHFQPQRLNINEIAQLKFTKKDYIIFHSDYFLEFTDSLIQKLKIAQYDHVILYINPKLYRIGFRFYYNKSFKYHKKRDLLSKQTLLAIKSNPQLFHSNKQDIICGYLIYNNKRIFNDFCFEKQYVIKIQHIIKQYPWIKQNIHYQLQFDYIHNRWEVRL